MVKPLKGIVISNKMMKSVTVMVERIYKHPRWGKYVRGRKKYMGASEAPRRIPKSLSRSRDRTHRCRVQSFPFPPARAHPLSFVPRADTSTSPSAAHDEHDVDCACRRVRQHEPLSAGSPPTASNGGSRRDAHVRRLAHTFDQKLG